MTILDTLHAAWCNSLHNITPQLRTQTYRRFCAAVRRTAKLTQDANRLADTEQEFFTKAHAQTRGKPFTLDGETYVAFSRLNKFMLRSYPQTKRISAAVEPRLAWRLKLLLTERTKHDLAVSVAKQEAHEASRLMVLTFGNHHATVDGVIYDPACSKHGVVFFIPRRTGTPDAVVYESHV